MKNSRFPLCNRGKQFCAPPLLRRTGLSRAPSFYGKTKYSYNQVNRKVPLCGAALPREGALPLNPPLRRRAEAAKGRSAQFTATAFRVIRVATSRG